MAKLFHSYILNNIDITHLSISLLIDSWMLFVHAIKSTFLIFLLILFSPLLQQMLTLVFVETKRGADSLESWLCMNGFPATSIHGDRNQQVCFCLYSLRNS